MPAVGGACDPARKSASIRARLGARCKYFVAVSLLLSPPVLAQTPEAGAGREHVFTFAVDDGFCAHLFVGNAWESAIE